MDGYLQVYDSPNYGRAYVVSVCAKILAGILLTAFVFLTFGDGVGVGSKIAGVIVGITGVAVGYWAYTRKYLCLQCRREMKVRKKDPIGAGDTPLFLVCDHCKCYIDLKVA